MNIQTSNYKTNSASYSRPNNKPSNDDYRNRRRLEMKRRFVQLPSKRSHLERELELINASLFSLDKQMKNYAAYEQLTINE